MKNAASTGEQPVTDRDVFKAMTRYGGAFATALAKAWMVGDEENRARIKATWPEYWEKYGELAVLSREHDRARG